MKSGLTHASDKIQLSTTIFTGINIGALNAADFVNSATGIAQDATDHILYNSNTGAFYYDADGSGAGAAIQFATLTGAPTLLASDFTIV